MNSKKIGIITFLVFLGFLSGFFVNMYALYPMEIKNLSNEMKTDYIKSEIYETDVLSLIHVSDNFSKSKLQNKITNYLWNQNNLPDKELTKIEKNIFSEKYSNLKNLESIDKLTIEMEYGVNSIAYLFNPLTSNDKLIIYHQGHRGDFVEGKQTIAYFLEKNYSVMAFSMPLLGMNSQPIIDHPQFGKIKIQSHNQFELVENENFSPIKFFVEPVIVSINYLEKYHTFDSYHMIGISGGGWATTLIAALDDRINESFSVAGSHPIFLRSDPKNFGDYEQHHIEFYEIANYLDLYVMASTGLDRKFVQIFNKFDPCCFDGDSFSLYEQQVKETVTNLGDGYFEIYLDDTHNEHIISNHTLEIIINELEN